MTVSYGERPVLRALDWEVRSGEKWVVSGPNGSGKSTLLSLIYADHPQAYAQRVSVPEVLLLDEPFQGMDHADVARGRRLLTQLLRPDDTVVFISHYPAEIPDDIPWQYLRLGH